MKKLILTLIAALTVANMAAPTFAATASNSCTFQNAVFCGDTPRSLIDSED